MRTTSPQFEKKEYSETSDRNGHFYIVGGGIGGLNTALLLLREGVSGKQITIYEQNKECGGIFYRETSNNGASFFAHTIRTFDEPSYHYTQLAWRKAGIWNTNHLVKINPAPPLKTEPSDLLKVACTIAMKSDEELEGLSIAELLPQKILKTPVFRYFFHLTGLFDHHSALALKRYMIHTHADEPMNWDLRSVACDYESIVEPIVGYLMQKGVRIENEKMIQKLSIKNNHVHAIDDHELAPNDKVIVTIGANVGKELFTQDVLIHDSFIEGPLSPDTPFASSKKQPHSSVWLLAHDDLACQIESVLPGSERRDFIHIDIDHPWQITLISLREKYYKEQPKNYRLFYIAMNNLSMEGLHVKHIGTECTNEELCEEVLKRLKIWDIVQQMPTKYTATVDTRARQFIDRDSAPIVRFMPNESAKILVFPDTECDNLAVIGERVKAYRAPVPTTEWVTETGHRAIQYLMHGTRYRMSPEEYKQQEKDQSWKFIGRWAKVKMRISTPPFTSTIYVKENPAKIVLLEETKNESSKESLRKELKSLVEIINDSHYWIAKSNFSSKIAEGLQEMQKLTISLDHNFEYENNPAELFNQLRAIAIKQLNKEKGLLYTIFGYDLRDNITYALYRGLINVKRVSDISECVRVLRKDREQFYLQENTRYVV